VKGNEAKNEAVNDHGEKSAEENPQEKESRVGKLFYSAQKVRVHVFGKEKGNTRCYQCRRDMCITSL
jgi:hypothetical protein